MARAALGLSAHDLAGLAKVSRITIARFEAGENIAEKSREKMEAALVKAGAQFTRRAGRIGASVPE